MKTVKIFGILLSILGFLLLLLNALYYLDSSYGIRIPIITGILMCFAGVLMIARSRRKKHPEE